MFRRLSERLGSTRRIMDELGLSKRGGCGVGAPRFGTGLDDSDTIIDMPSAPNGIEKCIPHENDFDELGNVAFEFDGNSFLEAKTESRVCEKPIFLLFQDLPGSDECAEFGRTVLSHPLLVEAIESLFISVVVNSRGGSAGDAELLARYHETHCGNGPIVRIVNEKGKDLVVRLKDSDCSVAGIAGAMVKALERTQATVPTSLRLLAANQDHDSPHVREVVFAMAEQAQAEIEFASMSGVLGTELGTVGSQRVIKLLYDSSVVSYSQLIRHGLFFGEMIAVFFSTPKEAEDAQAELEHFGAWPSPLCDLRLSGKMRRGHNNKSHILLSNLRYVPLTSIQSVRVNRALSMPNGRTSFQELLSPRQLAILEAVETKQPRRHVIDVEISQAWKLLRKSGVYDWNH